MTADYVAETALLIIISYPVLVADRFDSSPSEFNATTQYTHYTVSLCTVHCLNDLIELIQLMSSDSDLQVLNLPNAANPSCVLCSRSRFQ